MIYRTLCYPTAFDWEFYKDRDPVDHWKQYGLHHERLADALRVMTDQWTSTPESVADFCCGTAGLLAQIKGPRTWGYDISPTAVAFAKEVYGVNVELADITLQGLIPSDVPQQYEIEYPEWLLLTETLEHLLNPFELLTRVRDKGVRYVVASVPSNNGGNGWNDNCHNWAWTGDSFIKTFELCEYKVLHYEVSGISQFIVGESLC